jgi:hypothetical protein
MEKNDKTDKTDKIGQYKIVYPKTMTPEEYTKQVDKYKENFNHYIDKIHNEQKKEGPHK